MVYCFSGIGNSRLAAEQIAAALEDELISINHCLKVDEQKTFHSERPLVFVTPTYAWRMPKAVSDWIGASPHSLEKESRSPKQQSP